MQANPLEATKIEIGFTRSSGFLALLVRLGTRRRRQSLTDVPAHTYAIVTRGNQRYLYESVAAGVHRVCLSSASGRDPRIAANCTVATFDVSDLVNIGRCVRYLDKHIGDRYAWMSIFLKWLDINISGVIALFNWPIVVSLKTTERHEEICSEYIERMLKAGATLHGLSVNLWLWRTDNSFTSPTAPNDLMLALRAASDWHSIAQKFRRKEQSNDR